MTVHSDLQLEHQLRSELHHSTVPFSQADAQHMIEMAIAGNPATGRRWIAPLAAAAVIAVVLSVSIGFGGGPLGSRAGSSAASALSTPASTAPVQAGVTRPTGNSVADVAKKLRPSMVWITSLSSSPKGGGTGIILSADGLILTNNRVVAGATSLTVRFDDESTAKADLKGVDATDDLAVIKVRGVSGLTTATLGSSADLFVGQPVVAVGSSPGLPAEATSGVVSTLNRPVRTPSPGLTNAQTPTVFNAIQTDAAINPGNWGGALVNMNGQVIGINSALATLAAESSTSPTGSAAVGFAMPIDQARRIADEIIQTGKATHAVLGAVVIDAIPAAIPLTGVVIPVAPPQRSGSPRPDGARIDFILPGGSAERAGLQPGDVITKVAGQPVQSAEALIASLQAQSPGSTVQLTYRRDSTSKTITVTLGSVTSN